MDRRSHSTPSGQGKALVLCRTPFQAVLVRNVLSRENIDRYDLIYFTQDNAEEDLNYFEELSATAEDAQYIFIEGQKYDILNHIKAYLSIKKRLKRTVYDEVFISSIDNLAFRKLAVSNKQSKIISFDDGTGHINLWTRSYNDELNAIRSVIRRTLFSVPSEKEFINIIYRHYSAYRSFENIMPSSIIRYVDLFQDLGGVLKGPAMKFFIGQPFDETEDMEYILKLKKYVYQNECDFYVLHPRERSALIERIPILAKEGRIAEEAIFKISRGRRIMIFGGFSTVLINISPAAAEKVMILRQNVARDKYYAEIGARAGCQIVFI